MVWGMVLFVLVWLVDTQTEQRWCTRMHRETIESIRQENKVLEQELSLEGRQAKMTTSRFATRYLAELSDTGDGLVRKIETEKRRIAVLLLGCCHESSVPCGLSSYSTQPLRCIPPGARVSDLSSILTGLHTEPQARWCANHARQHACTRQRPRTHARTHAYTHDACVHLH